MKLHSILHIVARQQINRAKKSLQYAFRWKPWLLGKVLDVSLEKFSDVSFKAYHRSHMFVFKTIKMSFCRFSFNPCHC